MNRGMQRKQWGLAIGCALLSLAGVVCGEPLPIAAAIVCGVLAVLLIAASFSQRSSALFRLDWFVRALRRDNSLNALRRAAQRILPNAWFSDRSAKRRGTVRRWLRAIGLSWLASPIRRLTQAACLVAFLLLFFVVCWPYNARPAPPAQTSEGWRLQQIDGAGAVHLAAPPHDVEEWVRTLAPDQHVYLQPQTTTPATAQRWRVIEATAVADSDAVLQLLPGVPADAAGGNQESDAAFEAVLNHQGNWRICDKDPDAWPEHYAENLADKQWVPAESFLLIDPLVSISTAIASRSWVWSLTGAGVILIICVLVPRGFCGYLCPLGTTIDLFDWLVTGRTQRFRVEGDGWWVHIKYYLLGGILVSATMGVLLSGVFAAIPVVTRAALFLLEPLQNGVARGWRLTPALHAGHAVSIAMFLAVLSLGFLRPRFWCKYVCPSGAVFSLGNLFRISERKVESSCIHCNKCVEICPFDAIKPDFTTRATDCTLCQSCAGVCPTEAIKFVERWNIEDLKTENDPVTQETTLGRRGFLSLATGAVAAVAGGAGAAAAVKACGAQLGESDALALVRPPGSVPEREFLQMCIRCGECFKACPNNVLQAEGFQQGLEGLWAPMVVADWAGCESSCNACGQVCPTGAIRELPMEEKRVARMGLAIVNEQTCLPFAGKEDCDLCVQECRAAGYNAIEFEQVGTQVDAQGIPIEGTGRLAPVVLADACVGCGLCQTRCYGINVIDRGVLKESAIIIEAGDGKEDRLMTGSYIELRAQREAQQETQRETQREGATMPTAPAAAPPSAPSALENPFGVPGEPIESAPADDASPGNSLPTDDENPFQAP